MAVVNVDLSEYVAIRKRNSELEEQVKELKKLNESLKSGSKVILRKETVVIERFFRERSLYDDMFWQMPTGDGACKENRHTLEPFESYVNFEDVRFNVEQAMKDEINRSINDRNQEKQTYTEMKNKLVNEQVRMKSNLQKEYEKKAKDLEEEYHRKKCDFESEKLRIHADLLCVHQFKPNSHPQLTHEENCPEFEEYLKASPNDWWCRTGDLLKKEHRELYWR